MTTIQIPAKLTLDEAISWLLEHAPEIAERLLAAFNEPGPVAQILEGDGASAAELTKRRS